ncbi:MAG: hypothetical protein SO444_03460 [Candidatus Onthomorpha sp.]|nr:hypothetical protein [Candidatus Onthomorpha sp.]
MSKKLPCCEEYVVKEYIALYPCANTPAGMKQTAKSISFIIIFFISFISSF